MGVGDWEKEPGSLEPVSTSVYVCKTTVVKATIFELETGNVYGENILPSYPFLSYLFLSPFSFSPSLSLYTTETTIPAVAPAGTSAAASMFDPLKTAASTSTTTCEPLTHPATYTLQLTLSTTHAFGYCRPVYLILI